MRLNGGCIALASLLLLGTPLRGLAAEALTLATTTSVQDSGLLGVLLPPFEKQNEVTVKVLAVGSGQALELGRRGDADVLLVHSPDEEAIFVKKGHGLARRPFMYNDFLIVGPNSDPAHIRGLPSAASALGAIAKAQASFASRGDESGTHAREKQLWRRAEVQPAGDWYLSCGAGMAATLRVADEKLAYALADRSTWLAWKSKLALQPMVEGDPVLLNTYSVIVASPSVRPAAKSRLAQRFADYVFSDEARAIISRYGKDKYGRPLFHLLPKEKAATTAR